MMGKLGLLSLFIFFGILLVLAITIPYSGYSAEYETGSTTMNVTIRGYVAISVSDCLTNGITFLTQDPNTNDNNGSCNNITNGGSAYNLTVDPSSTANINFTHATNRTNLTDGSNYIYIGNVTTNTNSTANNGANILDASLSASLSNSWAGMETCENLGDGSNCWATYFLDVPSGQAPGNYLIGYCWCGRQQGTTENNCGTCT